MLFIFQGISELGPFCRSIWHPLPRFSLELNLKLIFSNLKNSIFRKTWLDYCLSWSKWCSFCHTMSLDTIEVNAYVSLAFVSNLIQAKLSPAIV